MLLRDNDDRIITACIWNGTSDYYGTGEKGELLDPKGRLQRSDLELNRVKPMRHGAVTVQSVGGRRWMARRTP